MLLFIPPLGLPRALIVRLGNVVRTRCKVSASLTRSQVCLHYSLGFFLLLLGLICQMRDFTPIKILLVMAFVGISRDIIYGLGLTDWSYLLFGETLVDARGLEE